MFDIGWTELLVIGVVALIVVGPKDLPVMFHRLGQFTARARGMAREFQRAMDDAAKEAGVKDVTRDLRNVTSPKNLGLDRLKEATRDMGLDPKAGPETRKLAEERAERAARAREATAKAAAEGKAADAPKAAETGPAEKAATPRKPARNAAAKPAARKPAGATGATRSAPATKAAAPDRPEGAKTD